MTKSRLTRHYQKMVARWRLELGVFLSVAAACLSGCGGRAHGAAAGGGPGSGGRDTPAGNAGSAPTPIGGAPSEGGAGGGPDVVDPAVSRAWTWEACGTLRPDGGDREALFDAAGRIIVLGPRGVRVYEPSGALAEGIQEVPADFLIASPDGSVLSGVRTMTGVELRPVGAAGSLAVPIPADVGCGPSLAFSGNGQYLVASGGAQVCAFLVADGLLAGRVAGEQGVMLDSTFVVVERETASIVLRDLAGAELSRRTFENNESVVLSPRGDRAVIGNDLVDLKTGEGVAWDRSPEADARPPIFSPRGEMVFAGDGVFRTSDGARVFDVPNDARFSHLWSAWSALSPDGARVVLPSEGRATLYDVESRGVTAVLGPPPLPNLDNRRGVSDLAISADGALLVSNVISFAAFGLRVAPQFADSQLAWSMRVEMSFSVDVSQNRQFAAIGGDGRAIYDGRDASLVWPSAPPPPVVSLENICLLDRFDLSPQATWVAGSDYSGKLRVFRFDGGRANEPWKLHAVLPAHCDVPAFSRDERLLATSAAALYRVTADEAGWQEVWSHPLPVASMLGEYGPNDVEFSPDQSLLAVSRCQRIDGPCVTDLLDVETGELARAVPELEGPHPAFSPDGSWLVAGNQLLHLASGDVRTFRDAMDARSPALFAPNGDIIAGAADGALTRYCRAK